jgi:hypothetical protein
MMMQLHQGSKTTAVLACMVIKSQSVLMRFDAL